MSAPGARFPRAARLTKPSHFAAVFAARQKLCGRFFCVHWRENGLPHARLGLVVAKRVAKRAVRRNWLKRQIREIFRVWPGRSVGVDLVVRVTHPPQDATRRMLRAELEVLFARLLMRLLHSEPAARPCTVDSRG